jgi:hypothetical protein
MPCAYVGMDASIHRFTLTISSCTSSGMGPGKLARPRCYQADKQLNLPKMSELKQPTHGKRGDACAARVRGVARTHLLSD